MSNIYNRNLNTSVVAGDSVVVFKKNAPSYDPNGDEALISELSEAMTCTWHPSDPTGSTNMAAELESFVAGNQGRRVKVAPGSIILLENFGQQGALSSTDSVDIDFGETNILQTADIRCIDLDNTSNAGSEISVTTLTDVTNLYSNDAYSTKLDLASSSGALAHDFIAVYAEDGYTGKSGVKVGEIAQLFEDEASNTLYTVGQLSLSASFTTGIKVRVLSKSERVRIVGGVWESNGDADDTSITSRQECIRIIGYVDPEFADMEFKSPWAQTIWMQCTAGARVDNIKLYDVFNMAVYNGFSYGPYLYGMNFGAQITNIKGRNCRHPGITTDGDSSPSNWYEYGYPTRNVIDGVYGYNCYGSLIDSHEEGADNVYSNIRAFNHYSDVNESFVSRVIQSRAIRDTFINVYSEGQCAGIRINDIDHGILNVIKIRDSELVDVYNGSSNNATAIDIDNRSATGELRVELDNVKISGCDRGVDAATNVEIAYNNLTINGADVGVFVRDGSFMYGRGLTMDFSQTIHAGTGYAFFLNDTCKVLCLDKPVIVMGGANIPREFFSDSDGTGTKTVWHPGLVVDDRGNTATLSKESGGTFTNSTEINEVAL